MRMFILSFLLVFLIPVAPVVADTVTFYSTASDGMLYGGNALYSTIHNAASSPFKDDTSNWMEVKNTWTTATYEITRGFLYFDTSSLPDDATITDATLSLYPTVKVEQTTGHTDINVVEGVQNDPLALSDYGAELSKTTSGGTITYASITLNQYNDITLNSIGMNWISKTGTTKFALRAAGDVINQVPSGWNYVQFYSNEKGAGYQPRLVVTYTAGSAQTELQQGETTFEVPNIILTPIPPPGSTQPPEDYTQTSQTIVLYGDLAYLNIKWNARYSDNVERPMGIDCYLNCPNPDQNIDTNCASYKTSTNYCSFVGSTGPRFCTIVRPNYLYKQDNNVTCKFYNPARLDIMYLPYPNRTFEPIDFQVFTERVTGTVGKSFILPANIRSTGLFVETYTVNVSAANPSQSSLVFIEDAVSVTSRLKYAEIGKVYPKVTFLSTEKVNLKISTKSNTDPTTCSIDSDCSYLGDSECIGNRCWKKNIIETSAQKASLPEFGLLGFLQIVSLAVILLFIKILPVRKI